MDIDHGSAHCRFAFGHIVEVNRRGGTRMRDRIDEDVGGVGVVASGNDNRRILGGLRHDRVVRYQARRRIDEPIVHRVVRVAAWDPGNQRAWEEGSWCSIPGWEGLS